MTNQSRVLKASDSAFDQVNTFNVEIEKRGRMITRKAYLYPCGAEGAIYIMLHSSTLKSSYTEADRAEQARLSSEDPVRNGDKVLFDGEEYQVKILGEFSDAGLLVKI